MGLAELLKQHHYRNKNGCWVTDYHKIAGLNLLASTTNGTSGIGKWQGRRVHWFFNDSTKQFEVAPA
jgi:uncharacterized protein YjaZ